ncbi:MAG: RNA-binding protein [Gloeomargarita sp. SKYBB_i_bin120]|nr:RNA-binding protein [Gloeomargarita sp. SKYG98]MCS7291438.1 RNA-binding protein [Gloeomargarita sp. SKYB120]MDW8176998.1 RNA-binding protein [Gloeomargarita sp. SKYBB_i_bin120]
MTVRIYVGNLPEDVKKEELLETLFRDVTAIQSLKLITNRKTQKCRGFGFLTVKTEAEADELVSRFNGKTFREQVLKVEKALPRTKDKEGKESKEAVVAAAPETVEKPVKANSRPQANRNGQRPANRRKATPTAHNDVDIPEPDPRWADALRRLRERLAQQEMPLK